MIDDSIEYRNIIMRCDRIEKTAYRNLSSDMEIEFFKEGMEAVWADVQKRAGEFKDVLDTDIMNYFIKRFGVSKSEADLQEEMLKGLEEMEIGKTFIVSALHQDKWASFSRSTKMQLAKYLVSYVDKHSDKFIVAEKVKGTINKYKKVM